jgi:tRNA pseudouridine55 synthase
MSRPPRRQRDVDGILLFDKPLGLSSNAALQQVRALFGAKKAGHAGSLDPLASGLLPVCFGQATKVCGRLLNSGKSYFVGVQLGATTPSLDCETAVSETAPVPALDDQAVDAVLATFMGEQEQVPPMHSALKHQGERLYELARRGESIERASRRIVIDRIERKSYVDQLLTFEVRCSKGTYIRSLAADIAAKLGTLGYVAQLRRLAVDPFDGRPMYTLEQIGSLLGAAAAGPGGADSVRTDWSALDALLLTADTAFADLADTHLNPMSTLGLLQGQTVSAMAPAPPGQLRAYGAGGRFLGLVEGQADGRVRPMRLFTGL